MSLDIIIPAVVSLIIGLGAHYVSLSINRSKNKTARDIRGYSSLEHQLEDAISKAKTLEHKLDEKDEAALELRDLKYGLEFKIELLSRELKSLQEKYRALEEENFQLRSEVSMLRNQDRDC